MMAPRGRDPSTPAMPTAGRWIPRTPTPWSPCGSSSTTWRSPGSLRRLPQDLLDAKVSPTGNASFWLNLWGIVTPDVDHVVRVEALDVGTLDAWTPLNLSPRTIRCHEYGWFDFDLFSVDPATGAVKQLTNTPGISEWNPEPAPTGSLIVHERTRPSGMALAITNTATGTTRVLKGSGGGNNGTWTPDGKRIVFDRGPSGDPSLYIVSAAGGTRRLISHNAVEADVSARNGRVVFLNPSTSRIVTTNQQGTSAGRPDPASQGEPERHVVRCEP